MRESNWRHIRDTVHHFSYDYPFQDRETCQSRAPDVPTLGTSFRRNYRGEDVDPDIQPFYIFARLGEHFVAEDATCEYGLHPMFLFIFIFFFWDHWKKTGSRVYISFELARLTSRIAAYKLGSKVGDTRKISRSNRDRKMDKFALKAD